MRWSHTVRSSVFWAPENRCCSSTTTEPCLLSLPIQAPPPSSTERTKALESLASQCHVAILSGRDLADIRSRVAIPGVWYAGSHGFELTEPDGTYHRNDAAASAVGVLDRAAAELGESLAEIPAVRVEHKRFAVAVHYREVAPEHIGEIVSATHKIGQRDGLRVTNGRMLVELRPDIDWDKGTTLAWIRDRIDAIGSLLPIYIGDDLTDEDAFDAVQFDGIGIVVRHEEDGDRKTAARLLWRVRIRCGSSSSAGRIGWRINTEQPPRLGISPMRGMTRRARSFVSRCVRWEMATSQPGARRPNRRPARCTIPAAMPPGFTTDSSTTYRVRQSTTRVWSTCPTGLP